MQQCSMLQYLYVLFFFFFFLFFFLFFFFFFFTNVRYSRNALLLTLNLPYTSIKAILLQAWSGPEGSRKLRFPDFMTTAQEGGKVVILTHRPHLLPGNPPDTHFCLRLSRPQGHSTIGRIVSMKNSNVIIWNRTSDLPICSTAP